MKKTIFLALAVVTTLTSYAQQDNWQTYNTGFADVSGIIHAPAPDTLFIHRTDGSLLRSFNGGANWDSLFIRHDSTYFTELGSYFINGRVGFTWSIWSCMYTGGFKTEVPMLLKTTNSGLTWAPAMNGFSIDKVVVAQVHFWDVLSGFAIGQTITNHPAGTNYTQHHNNETYFTLDGGNTWVLNNSTPIDDIKNMPKMISFCDQYTGLIMGRELNFNYSKSTDGGFTWANTNIHKFGYNATAVKTQSPQNAFIVANDSLYVSTNGLQSFTASKLPFTNYNNSVMANNASFYTYGNTTYFLTFNDDIYKSANNLNSFVVSKNKNGVPNYAMAGNGANVYIYAANGNVYKTANVTAIKEVTKNTQDVFIYPNPTAENSINFSSVIKAKTYTITANNGTLLANKTIEGTTINTSTLPAGVYLVSFFDANNKLIASKKLIKR
jgi:photosystem II stability/assembly factor-like uncharacterized protein